MGRPRNEPPRPPAVPKAYQAVVSNPDDQAAFEAMAEHQHRANVETWLCDLARGYLRRYFSKRTPSTEEAKA